MRLEDLIGRRLGRYEIVEVLGRGGMAAVYRAHDTVLRRDVALKILYPQYTGDVALVERFQREAVLAAGLDHPNILPIYDVGETDGMVYIAMRLLSGESFADVLRLRGALPADELLPIVDQVAAALDYAHARQIVHRDIKPANILIEPASTARGTASLDGARAVLTDFGIAKSLDPAASGLTVTGVLIGTPEYMAPEQIRGGHTVDGRADVYALGILVYRALTGRRPFEGSTEEVLLGHLRGDIPAPSSVEPRLPPALNSVILRALARDPGQRYASAGELARALHSAAGLEPATPPPALRRGADGRAIVPSIAAGALTQGGTATRPGNGAPPYAARSEIPTRAQATRPGDAAPPYARPPVAPAERAGRGAQNIAWALVGVLLAVVLGGGVFFAARMLAGPAAGGSPVAAIDTRAPTEAPTEAATGAPTESPTEAPTGAPTNTPAPTEPAATALAQPTRAPAPTARPRPTARPPAPPTAAPTEPPTATPTATPEPSPTPTEGVPPTPTPCQVAVAPDLAAFLQAQAAVANTLGCATQAGQDRQIAEQNFQRGAMIWVAGTSGRNGTIYVIVDDEAHSQTTWQVYEDTWQESDSADSGDATPPPGRYEPMRGFGKLWYAHQDVREALGWAIEEKETGGSGTLQRFAGGRVLRSSLGFGEGPSFYAMYQDTTFATFRAQ
jgi:serine/threonine-protein kinase